MAKLPVDYIERLSAEWEPKLRDAFLAAVYLIRSRARINVIAQLLEEGRIEEAVQAVEIDPVFFRNLDIALEQTFEAGGRATAGGIPRLREPSGAEVKILFDVRNLRAETWLRQRSLELISDDIIADQKVMIRRHLTAGMEAGKNPRTVALRLAGRVSRATGQREGGVIGLHSQQEQWHENYIARLSSSDPAELRKLLTYGLRDKRYDRSIRKAIREEKPLPAEFIAKMDVAYKNNALRYRGDLIAKEEALTALGESQDQAYRQAIDAGQIERNQVRRFCFTAGDERVRTNHRLIPGMNKEGVGIDEPFQTPDGPRMKAPFDVGCRCNVRIRLNFLERAIQRLQQAG